MRRIRRSALGATTLALAVALALAACSSDESGTTSGGATVASKLILGGPPECPTRPFCIPGLKQTYGITFKSFKPLDVGGAQTVAALKAGAVQVAGRTTPFALYTGLSNVLNYGYNGIGVALIGRNHPLGIIVAGMFFGTLQAGFSTVQLYARVPFEIIQVIEGIIIFAVAAPELYRRFRGSLKR